MSDAKIIFMLVLVFFITVFGNLIYQNILSHEYKMAQLECSK